MTLVPPVYHQMDSKIPGGERASPSNSTCRLFGNSSVEGKEKEKTHNVAQLAT